MTDGEDEAFIQRLEKDRLVRAAFSPSAPITRRDLFAGRAAQLVEVGDAIAEAGQHIVIYGERGVGKTSLATVCKEMVDPHQLTAIKINCQSEDTFSSVWRKAFHEIKILSSLPAFGFGGQVREQAASASQYFATIEDITPDHVRIGLCTLSTTKPVVVFFDEFDRLSRAPTHRTFADTLKTLSDEVIPATVVIVGVADDVDELIEEHTSVERALVQIHMPRMSRQELADIIVKGLASVQMSVQPRALERITALSQGLPHYTHLLTQQAASAASWNERTEVRSGDVDRAIQLALKKTQESINDLYYRATFSARENMYKQVLLACACARADDRGFFPAAGIRAPLSKIMGKPLDIPQFALHLNALSSDRGPMLRKEGTAKKFRYRFINPLIQPYVIMRGLADGMIDSTALEAMQAPVTGR